MALMNRKVRAQQGTIAVPVKTPAEDWRLAEGGLWYPGTPGAGQFRERDGVIAGNSPAGASRPLDVIATSASTFMIYPGRFVLGGSVALAGTYEGVVDAGTVRTIPGASLPGAGNYKAGLVVAHVYDQTYGDTQDGFDLEIVLGAAASTPAGAVFPGVPTNSLLLKQFTVDSTGTITLGGYLPPFTVARGGIVPVQSADSVAGGYVGQYRDHPTYGLQRWDGAGWNPLAYGAVRGKMWRTGGGGPSLAVGVDTVCAMGASRVSGGFAYGADALTVPVDGLYDLDINYYLTNPVTGNCGVWIRRIRSGVGNNVIGQKMAYKAATNVDIQDTYRVPGLPLRAGDQLALTFYAYVASIAFFGTSEPGAGCSLAATYAAPLNGAVPV